ncbi:MAG: single-stranded DNA-binding protein [Paludibacteraceae bacterium]|nr:single-stranded DNA-binding protein [Paludibacteraceae bacterium]
MNKVQLVGRLTRDVELRQTTGDESIAIARFGVAVNRKKKDEADFISCVAFGKTAETLDKYFSKGSRIAIAGRIQTGSYTNKEGAKVYTTDVVVEEFDFIDTKSESTTAPAPVDDKGFMDIPDNIDEELPFT